MSGTKRPDLLIVSDDAKLRAEMETALAALGAAAPLPHFAANSRQGIDLARNRQPELALVELTADVRGLRTLARELLTVAPDLSLACTFRPELLGEDVSEAALIIEALHAGASDFLRRPISTAALEELLERHRRTARQAQAQLGRVVSFISNKGGVGKSTTAVNAAVALAVKHPERVLLVDASLQMGVAASMLNLQPAASLVDAARERDRLDETLLRELATPHESGLHLLAAPEDAVLAAEVDDEVIARVVNVARRTYDFVLIDTFPLLDRVIVAVLDLSDRAYVVLENVVPTLLGGVKLLQLLDKLDFARERRRLVLNRYTPVAGGLRPAVAGARLGQELDFIFPYDKRVLVAANTGQPYALSAGRFSRFRRTLSGLVSDLESLAPSDSPPLDSLNGKSAQRDFRSALESEFLGEQA